MLEAAVAAKAAVGALALMAVHGTVLALIALVLARRVRPALQAAFWLVVLAKLVLPWGPSLPWSLSDLLASLRGGEEAANALVVVGATGSSAPDAVASASPWWLVLAVLWYAGSLVVIARAALRYRRARVAAERAMPAPTDARVLLQELARRVRVRAPNLVVGASPIGPHVIGLLRPIIVVPPALLEDHALLRAALLHELAHVRRLDALGRIIQLAAVALFWFYPVVRLASRRLERAREAACDAWALEAGDISRPAYARLLVQMAQLHRSSHGHAHGALALAAPYALDDRVAGVLGPPVRARLGAVHWLALAVWIPIALGGARTAEARADRANVCVYTVELAEALRQVHPEADADGDGVLSHEEACDFQAELNRRVAENPQTSTFDTVTAGLLAEPLCCNCDAGEGTSAPATVTDASCQSEGVDR